MCGTSLEPRRPLGSPALDPLSAFPPAVPAASPSKTAHSPAQVRPVVVEDAPRVDALKTDAPRTGDKPGPPIAGPSMLGLNQPVANQPTPHEPDLRHPSMDLLRDRSFSGLDSFLEPEQSRTGARRILLMLGLLVALGAAGWWTYTNYLGATEGRKPEPTASTSGDTSAEKASTKPSTQDGAPTPATGSSQTAAPSAEVPAGPTENASTSPDPTRKALDAGTKPAA